MPFVGALGNILCVHDERSNDNTMRRRSLQIPVTATTTSRFGSMSAPAAASSADPDASLANGPIGLRTATRKAARLASTRPAGGLKRTAASRLTAFPQTQPSEWKRSSMHSQFKIFSRASMANCQGESEAL